MAARVAARSATSTVFRADSPTHFSLSKRFAGQAKVKRPVYWSRNQQFKERTDLKTTGGKHTQRACTCLCNPSTIVRLFINDIFIRWKEVKPLFSTDNENNLSLRPGLPKGEADPMGTLSCAADVARFYNV